MVYIAVGVGGLLLLVGLIAMVSGSKRTKSTTSVTRVNK